jgi:hypothetical protein
LTHNDSGGPPVLFAVTREGKTVAQFRVNAPNVDWEDIALDDQGRLYIGDIGNNGGKRNELIVHQMDEPDPSAAERFKFPKPIRPTATWRLRFPGKPFDSESLFVHQGRGYLISKAFPGFPAELYRFDLEPTDKPVTLKHVATLPIRSPATAADVSADGKLLAVMTLTGPYLLRIDGDPLAAAKARPAHVAHMDLDIEGVCFVDEGLLATTEGRQVLLFRWEDFDRNVRKDEPATRQN